MEFEIIFKKIITKEDFVNIIDEINIAKELIFKEIDTLLSKKLEGRVSKDFQNFVEELEKKGVLSSNPEKNLLFFEEFKKSLQKIPQIKLELAFSPSRDFVEKISSFIEKNVGEKVILDIILAPEILGGIKIEFRGKYGDFSLLKKLNELSNNERF